MTFTAQAKKDLQPLARRITQWNDALDVVSPKCTCWQTYREQDVLDAVEGCPGAPHNCMGITVVAVRVAMNLLRLPNRRLSNGDLVVAARVLRDVFDGLESATSSVTFANGIVAALRDPAGFSLVRRCAKCGCTEDRACGPVGCFWVAADLCSACLPAPVGVRS